MRAMTPATTPEAPDPDRARAPLLALSLAVAALAWIQPVDATRSDPALTLVAAQALVDHGTLALDPYRGEARCAYDLERDYRVRRQKGSLYYFAPGAQVLAAPFVFVARRLGRDMLRPADEAATQNALSALLLGLTTWLLGRALSRLVMPRVALALTAVGVFGSPLSSTLATGLWGACFAVPLLLLALDVVVRAVTRTPPRVPIARPLLLALVAFACRPVAAVFVVALCACALALRGLSRRAWLAVLAGVLALALAWPFIASHVPEYYSLAKLRPQTPLLLGLYGTLLSPSRGLFVFCAFALPLLPAFWRARRDVAPAGQRALAWLGLTWVALQVLLVSLKGNWWGGYSFGPRLLTEAVPALMLLAALAWLRLAGAARARRRLASAFVVLALPAVAIHSGQGLWNPATQSWNRAPEPGAESELVLDWRFPQFLASSASVRARDIAWQARRLRPLRPGERVGAISAQAVFVDFHPHEIAWRPSRAVSALRLRPAGFDPGALYMLELRARAATSREVELRLGERLLARVEWTPPEPHARRFVVPGAWLQGPGEIELGLRVPAASRVAADDARVVGLDFHALRLLPLPVFDGRLDLDADALFAAGFSDVEHGARWTRDASAELLLRPRDGFARGAASCRLELLAGAFGRQQARLALDAAPLGVATLEGPDPQRATFDVPPERLHPGALQRLDLELPQAAPPPGDPRRLGLRLFALSIECRATPPPR